MALRRTNPFGSIRFRLTALASLVVAAVLLTTAIVLIGVQRQQLTTTLDATLGQRADAFEALGADVTNAATGTRNDDDRAVQLVSETGRVLAASPNLGGAPALAEPSAADGTQTVRTIRDLSLEDDAYRVLSRRVDFGTGRGVLHVIENVDDLNDAIRGLAVALAVTVPVVVVALAAIMWWLTGRTLRPVETIRAEVDAITSDDVRHRVHVAARDDEISRLAATMNGMLDRLAEAFDRQRRFVADAAHELRTPLTRIRTELEVDLAQPDRANHGVTHRSILDEATALQRLVDDLLHLAHTDAARTATRREPVDLDDIVLQELANERAAAPDMTFDARAVSAAYLMADPSHMIRLVRNLLSNATRHAATTVAVSLEEHDDHIELAIADDGPGIPIDDRERVFERFTRLDDARSRDHGGTGLGLAIARDIVDHAGGTIRYDTAHTTGARFVVTLPGAMVNS